MKVLISACLLGKNVKYNGGNNLLDSDDFKKLSKFVEFVPVCPEVFGGLSIPRVPSERQENKVFSKDGEDVTFSFLNGSEQVIDMLNKDSEIVLAIMKDKSPSCGVNYIYDGTFSNNLIKGRGIASEAISKNIYVFSEKELDKVFAYLLKIKKDIL